MSASVPLLLGIDAGGTFVEAMLARPDGTVLGTGTSGAGNPLTLDLDLVADHLAIAVGKAISGHDARQVSAAVRRRRHPG